MKGSVLGMFRKMKIGKKLVISFAVCAIIASLAGIISTIIMTNIDAQYTNALVNYGFAQGDIGKAMLTIADGRRASRDIIGFTDAQDIADAKTQLDQANADFNIYIKNVEKSLITPEAQEVYKRIQASHDKYVAKRDEVIALGNTTDAAISLRAQKMAVDELDPLYTEFYNNFEELLNMKITGGNDLSDSLTSQTRSSLIITIVIIVAALLAALWFGVFIARGISDPIKKCAERINQLAKGDLKSPVTEVQNEDETRILADATKEIVESLNMMIGDVDYHLSEMGNGNFTTQTQIEERYVGDFRTLLTSMQQIRNSLNATLSQINQSADQVASGADQVSSGAQALSQGSTEQASSVQELAATINEIADQVKESASNAQDALSRVTTVSNQVTESNNQMQEMMLAMNDITDSSNEISKIIKTIEDIAFQTNILALNAAVEAARAGAAGKGFAVVADEVRNLATKSQEASKNTSVLIERALKAVDNGTHIADTTAQSLTSVVDGTQEIVNSIDLISAASNQQATSITQITTGIDQISAVVQTNSATAEESAAASQELSSQAQILKDLVSRFKLEEIEENSSMKSRSYVPSSSGTQFEDKYI